MRSPWSLTGYDIAEPCWFDIHQRLTPEETWLCQDLQVLLERVVLDFKDARPAMTLPLARQVLKAVAVGLGAYTVFDIPIAATPPEEPQR